MKRNLLQNVSVTYVRILAALIALVVLPMCIITAVFYGIAKENQRNAAQEINSLYLSQSVREIEMLFKQINVGYSQVSQPLFASFERSQTGNLYEHIKYNRNAVYDMPNLGDYLKVKSEFLEELGRLQRINEQIQSVYFYDRQKEMVFTGNGVEYSSAEFFDKAWMPLASDSGYFAVMPTRPVENDGSVITLIYKSPNKSGNALIVNISTERLFAVALESLPNKNYTDLLVITSDETPVYYSNSVVFNDFRTSGLSLNEQRFAAKLGGEVVFITTDRLENFGWTFLTATKESDLYGRLRYISYWFWIEVAVLMLLAVWLTSLVSKRLYNPISYVFERLGKHDGGESSDMDAVRRIVDNVLDERHNLRKQTATLRESFMVSLLRGGIAESEDIVKNLKFLEIDMDYSNVIMAVISLSATPFDVDMPYREAARQSAVIEAVAALTPGSLPHFVCREEYGRYVLLFNCHQNEAEQVYEFAEGIREILVDKLETACNVAVSAWLENMSLLPTAYSSALNMLRGEIIGGNGRVLFMDRLEMKPADNLKYPSADMKLLLDCIFAGDKVNSVKIFERISKNLKAGSENWNAIGIRRVIIRMLTDLLDTLTELGYDADAIWGGECDIYMEMVSCNDINLALEVIFALIDTALSFPREGGTDVDNYYVREIINMIEEDAGGNMTMTLLSERLNITPSYIGRLFKHGMNTNFLTYLTNVRMEKAKEMLSKSGVRVKDVAEQLGYSNAEYFIKLFKKHTGITPANYKKLR